MIIKCKNCDYETLLEKCWLCEFEKELNEVLGNEEKIEKEIK